MKSAIDTRPPKSQPHLTLYGRDYVAKKRATTEAAFSDLKMIQSIARTMTRSCDIPERKGPISLTASSRKAEIFHIMRENHRLLNSLENLQPVTRTVDFEKENEFRQRYVINCSHSKRLSGEYDNRIEKIHIEDQAKLNKYKETVERRRGANRMATGASASMPSLTPMGSVSEANGQMSSSAPAGTTASPPMRKSGGKVGPSTTKSSGAASSSSSKPSNSMGASNQPGAAKDSQVRFDAPDGVGEGAGERMPATPHPNSVSIGDMAKGGNDDHELLVVDDKICVVMQTDQAGSPAGAAPDQAPPEEEDEWAAALMEEPKDDAAPPEAASREFDPSSMADASSKGDAYDEYEEDFADESMNTTSKSAKPKPEDEPFEEEDEFEQSATDEK